MRYVYISKVVFKLENMNQLKRYTLPITQQTSEDTSTLSSASLATAVLLPAQNQMYLHRKIDGQR